MSAFSSPPRFLPPISPRRVPSPNMSPGGRRGRTLGSSEESHLRDLSPNTTLRAFTERVVPFDTARDEYKIFACIENLTAAERDLGARVAKAAQRLRGWCQEIEQWGWTGSYEQPSETFREKRRKSLELRIREHVGHSETVEDIGPLEYWGSLLSVEVEEHEARLDEIGDELLSLDIEELKEHVLDIHGPNRSRPSSSGYDSSRQNYTPLDDFSFLITQTLLSALPEHFKLKDRLSTWTARVSVLREAPRFLNDLQVARKAMQLGWDAIEPPTDTSDSAFDKWKEAVDTISSVLRGKVGNLGQRLDRMLDTLEGREDCLPDDWIDTFEGVEANYGQWAHQSRKRVIEFDLRRKANNDILVTRTHSPAEKASTPVNSHDTIQPEDVRQLRLTETTSRAVEESPRSAKEALRAFLHSSPAQMNSGPTTTSESKTSAETNKRSVPISDEPSQEGSMEERKESLASEDDNESVFEEGDTVVHNDPELPEDALPSPSDNVGASSMSNGFADSPIIITTTHGESRRGSAEERPRTPRLRRDSVDSVSSDLSFSSSPASVIEESPSIRKTTSRQAKTPKPTLNAAMGKRRPLTITTDSNLQSSVPWPPSQFSKQDSSSADDLERKISDILTTIPAHIRLTSGPGPNSPEVKPTRGGLTHRGSRGFLRATRSISGMKSPELTLSPAKQGFESANAASGRKSAAAMRGDNDIKLYHLTQPGKEHPIKLFIRRVGENGERVMVRVGGGWADLGEYLRQYAEHHGRRTVSDGKFEILGLEVNNPESPRPESAMSKGRARRMSGGSHIVSPNTTPKKTMGLGIGKEEAIPPIPSLVGTPLGAAGDISTPSTGSSRHSWTGNEAGLAGPKSKKLDLSGEKLEWIEGMMKQARTVSGSNLTNPPRTENAPVQQRENTDSRSDSRTGARKQAEFGDLGKFGGTKRVFLRGGKLSEH